MENAPVISLTFANVAPGTDDEIVHRYLNWIDEAYAPMMNKVNGVTGSDRYTIIHKNPMYPYVGMIRHYENIGAYQDAMKGSEHQAVYEDLNSWVQRGVREGVWATAYELVQSFRAGTASMTGKKDTKIENAPLMHLEACLLTPEEQEKYNKWFNEYGRVFILLLMKTCGLKGYDYLKYSGFNSTAQARETDYPPYLSLFYFEDQKAFEHFEESPELVSFQSALRNIFPLGLNYKWYVQYQLVKSWRK